MKKLVISALAALALMVPVSAHADGGYVGAAAGNVEFSDYYEVDVITLGGSVDVQISNNNWRAQFDADVNRYSTDYDSTYTSTNTAAHVYYDGGSYAIGAVLANTDVFYGSVTSIGVEGQVDVGPVIIEAEASFGEFDGYGDVGVTMLDLSATWYATENFSVLVGISSIDIDTVSEEFTTTRIEGEYQFAGTPISVFANFATTDIYDEDVDRWMLGLRYNFGSPTLRARREEGPHFVQAPVLPFLYVYESEPDYEES